MLETMTLLRMSALACVLAAGFAAAQDTSPEYHLYSRRHSHRSAPPAGRHLVRSAARHGDGRHKLDYRRRGPGCRPCLPCAGRTRRSSTSTAPSSCRASTTPTPTWRVAGQQRLTVDLDGTASLAEMLDRIRTYAAKAAPGQWILGGGWDHTKWASKTLPTRQDLDAVTGGHPAFLYRTDGHIAVANTAALPPCRHHRRHPAPDRRQDRPRRNGRAHGHRPRSPRRRSILPQIPPPDPEIRRNALQCRHRGRPCPRRHLRAGLLRLGGLPRARGDGARRPASTVRVSEWLDFNQPIATLEAAPRPARPCDDPMLHITPCSRASWMARWARAPRL